MSSSRQPDQKANDRIVFLSVPEGLREKIGSVESDDFEINPAIPIPVEIPRGEEKLNLEELSWEMIISGMLRVVAHGDEVENANYYRRFILAVKPTIQGEFTEAAILKARNGDFSLALEILDALRGLFPHSPSVRMNRALVLEQWAESLEKSGRDSEKKLDEAFEAYNAVLNLEPPLPDAFFNAGFFYMKQHDFEKAKDCLQRYMEIGEDDTKRKKAKGIIREIESRDLDDSALHEAYELIKREEEEKGLEKIRDFLGRHPEVWNGWFVLGWALRRLERWQDAIGAFEKVIEFGGSNADTHNELAICRMELGDLIGARAELEKALAQEPENLKVISNLGMVALRSGKKEEAQGFFRAALDLDPEDPVASHYLENL